MIPKFKYITPEQSDPIVDEVLSWERIRPDGMDKYIGREASIIRTAVMEYIANKQGLTYFMANNVEIQK